MGRKKKSKYSSFREDMRRYYNENYDFDIPFFIPDETLFKGITPLVAIDCEMVECETNLSVLARISIVNYDGHVILD